MYLSDSGNPIIAAAATTSGTTPPIVNRIGQPYCGTRKAATSPGMAPPIGTQPTAMMASNARIRRGADSTLRATTFGMTPPMPMPASSRSQNI